MGRINGRLLDLELSALEQKQQLDIIASPRLLASHLQPASIKQGSEIPYQVSSGESGATSVEFKEAVLGMEVTPTVLQKGRIRLKTTYQPECSRSGATTGRRRSAGDR
ncbi:outer membrane porin HofQ [Salmonella enterica subsp. arizonae]|uniref:Outer membrane porin HofQ n=1 Tax=Salmonella enterica subsp. arizonae TaxID=59203 RepID=A0A2X4SYH7_SALER|nr:outer membrane porin HofQ [Salmonella enterica subsp. arizonae]